MVARLSIPCMVASSTYWPGLVTMKSSSLRAAGRLMPARWGGRMANRRSGICWVRYSAGGFQRAKALRSPSSTNTPMVTRVGSAQASPMTATINNNAASSLHTLHLLHEQPGMKQQLGRYPVAQSGLADDDY